MRFICSHSDRCLEGMLPLRLRQLLLPGRVLALLRIDGQPLNFYMGGDLKSLAMFCGADAAAIAFAHSPYLDPRH